MDILLQDRNSIGYTGRQEQPTVVRWRGGRGALAGRREETLDAEMAEAILDSLARFHYASTEHAVFALLWETGIRSGAANSLDVGDVDMDKSESTWFTGRNRVPS